MDVVMRDGTVTNLGESDIPGLPVCPPPGTRLEKPRGSLHYEIDAKRHPWGDAPFHQRLLLAGIALFFFTHSALARRDTRAGSPQKLAGNVEAEPRGWSSGAGVPKVPIHLRRASIVVSVLNALRGERSRRPRVTRCGIEGWRTPAGAACILYRLSSRARDLFTGSMDRWRLLVAWALRSVGAPGV